MNKVTQVILNRKSSINYAKQVTETLAALELQTNQLEKIRQKLLRHPKSSSNLIEQLNLLILTKLQDLIIQEKQAWEKLWKRFSRETINIGVAGRARQGKSTFLQNVCGLSDEHIPASDRMACTSVQSNIYHSTADSHGLVHFYSQDSFLEQVIKPYYEELGFSNPPQTLEEFRSHFPSRPINPKHPAKAEAIYNHLRDNYYQYLDKYADLLEAEARIVRIPIHQIKQYVAQEYNAEGKPQQFKHLAVEKVDIFCKFPVADAEKIGLVDMPGLGDTRLGDEQRMIQALGEDVDFILFIRRPNPQGNIWEEQSDLYLHDVAAQTLQNKLALEEWSFLVLNADEHNQVGCKDLENTRESKGIHVKKCLIANCKKTEEANKVIIEVIDYLADNIENLDKQYMSACKNSLKALQLEIKNTLNAANTILNSLGDDFGLYTKLRDDFLDQLYNNIEILREKLRQEIMTPDADFKAQVEAAISRCDRLTELPSPTEIEFLINKYGIAGAYFDIIHQMRPAILKQFHPIETGLQQSLDKTKSEIADLFLTLGLNHWTNKQGVEFLEMMTDTIPVNLQSLSLGFRFISTFEFLYKGFIQSVVWRAVSEYLPSNPRKSLGREDNEEGMIAELTEIRQKAIENCQKNLDGSAILRSKIGCSMVEEFADHITRAAEVKQEWDVFLYSIRTKIWTELTELGELRNLGEEGGKLINEGLSLNAKLNFV